MHFNGQKILPAMRKMKDIEKSVTEKHFPYIVILDSHVAQIKPIVSMAKQYGTKVLLHADLVQGLKNDEHAAEYICQEVKPDGIISTRSNVLMVAKKRGILTIQRVFLLDSIALETSFHQLEKVKPDFVEVLPGLVPSLINELLITTQIPVIAGGLIRTEQDVQNALDAGATAVTTSLKDLWE